jgi:hypothetical protein
MLRVALVFAPLIVLASVVLQDQIKNSPAGLPPRADTDSELTEELRLLEQQLGEAAMHMDTKALERLVGAEYTLRIGDAPEESIPRAPWMDSLRPENPHPYKVESFHEQYHATRRLTDNLAVVSLLLTQKATNSAGRDRSGDFYLVDVWKKTGDNWQIIARYSTPVHKN